MDELGIEEQELTAQDQAAIEAEAEGASAPTASPPAVPSETAPHPAGQPDYIEELRKLAELKEVGVITEEEGVSFGANAPAKHLKDGILH